VYAPDVHFETGTAGGAGAAERYLRQNPEGSAPDCMKALFGLSRVNFLANPGMPIYY